MADDNDTTFSIAKLAEAMDPLGAELRAKLERFVHLIRGLTRSTLFRGDGLGLRCTPRGDGLFDVESVTPITDHEIRGLLTYFRQVWQSGEFAQFGSLRGELRRHVEASGLPASAKLVGWLDDIGRADRDARRAYREFAVLEAEVGEVGVLTDHAVRAERVLDDWVNGEVFHFDAEKNERIDWARDLELYRFALLAAVQEMTKIYVLFARMALAILDEPALVCTDA